MRKVSTETFKKPVFYPAVLVESTCGHFWHQFYKPHGERYPERNPVPSDQPTVENASCDPLKKGKSHKQ